MILFLHYSTFSPPLTKWSKQVLLTSPHRSPLKMNYILIYLRSPYKFKNHKLCEHISIHLWFPTGSSLCEMSAINVELSRRVVMTDTINIFPYFHLIFRIVVNMISETLFHTELLYLCVLLWLLLATPTVYATLPSKGTSVMLTFTCWKKQTKIAKKVKN